MQKRIEIPIGTNIGRAIMQNYIALEMLEFFLDESKALIGRDIALESHTSLNGLDRIKINTNLDGRLWHVFCGDLQPEAQKIKRARLVIAKIQKFRVLLTIHLVLHKDRRDIWHLSRSRTSC